jgi:hypothetical protein
VDGAVQSQTFTVRMDPRVKTSAAALTQQHDLSVALYDAMLEANTLAVEARAGGRAEFAGAEGFGGVAAAHQSVIDALQDSDAPATDVMVQAARARLAAYAALKRRWMAK